MIDKQLPATAKLDFSGTWNLNTVLSAFSPAPAPSAQTEIITQIRDDFTVDFASTGDDGKQRYLYTLKLGGPETPLKPILNETSLVLISAKGEWRGNSIVVDAKISYQGYDGSLTSTYNLSPDGNTLIKTIAANTDFGDFDLKAVYDKAM